MGLGSAVVRGSTAFSAAARIGANARATVGRTARSLRVLPILYTQKCTDPLRDGLAGHISRILILPIEDETEARAALRPGQLILAAGCWWVLGAHGQRSPHVPFDSDRHGNGGPDLQIGREFGRDNRSDTVEPDRMP